MLKEKNYSKTGSASVLMMPREGPSQGGGTVCDSGESK